MKKYTRKFKRKSRKINRKHRKTKRRIGGWWRLRPKEVTKEYLNTVLAKKGYANWNKAPRAFQADSSQIKRDWCAGLNKWEHSGPLAARKKKLCEEQYPAALSRTGNTDLLPVSSYTDNRDALDRVFSAHKFVAALDEESSMR